MSATHSRNNLNVGGCHHVQRSIQNRSDVYLAKKQWVSLAEETIHWRDCRARASSSFESSSMVRGLTTDGRRTGAVMSDERIVVEAMDSIPVEDLHLEEQKKCVSYLISEIEPMKLYKEKYEYMLTKTRVLRFLQTGMGQRIALALSKMDSRQAYCIVCLVEIGQVHVLSRLRTKYHLNEKEEEEAIIELSRSLERVEEFYDSIGGLAGYQLQCLKIICESAPGANKHSDNCGDACIGESTDMLVPKGLDIRSEEAKRSVFEGIRALGNMAEIYPLGGAGDRLGLQCDDTGESLPSAVLPYCGRSLLEHLIRDVQGREYLHFCLYGEQQTTPIAVMTSLAKGNHTRVMQLFEANDWFGRSFDSFKLFQQPMVPMIKASDGKWALDGPFSLVMKPGGHGVIWKLMHDNGVFQWLGEKNRCSAIVRQISNPMAGQDSTLLALGGQGISGNKAFGFASCERVVGAAEGMNVVLKEIRKFKDGSEKCTYRISNVEYTEFSKMGIEDKGVNGSTYSLFPANTNVLYLGLKQVEEMVRKSVEGRTTEAILPGMILNLNKSIAHINLESEEEECVQAGRLECTMQNLADCFEKELQEGEFCSDLPTFLVYGPRRKVTSSAKRKRKPGSIKIHQTPDGSFYDLQQNAKEMLEQCGMKMPDVGSIETYLENGPGFIFLFHPALGPLWDVVAQKINGGQMDEGSELQLEISEVFLSDVYVDGSLLVTADSVMGRKENGVLKYSRNECARISLENVIVKNKGIDFESPHNIFWRHRVKRKESCRIHLDGRSEFEARNITLTGDQEFNVPDGYRMIVSPGKGGDGSKPEIELVTLGSSPSWKYIYSLGNDILLKRVTL